MIAFARRWYRIIIVAALGLVLLVAARRLLGSSGDRAADPAPSGDEPAPSAPRPAAESAPPVTSRTPADSPDETIPDRAAVADPAGAGAATWVPPGDDGCPTSHPVKAKESSGIFHVEGGLSYERTSPDRCYLSPEAAEADGYRAAKR